MMNLCITGVEPTTCFHPTLPRMNSYDTVSDTPVYEASMAISPGIFPEMCTFMQALVDLCCVDLNQVC